MLNSDTFLCKAMQVARALSVMKITGHDFCQFFSFSNTSFYEFKREMEEKHPLKIVENKIRGPPKVRAKGTAE